MAEEAPPPTTTRPKGKHTQRQDKYNEEAFPLLLLLERVISWALLLSKFAAAIVLEMEKGRTTLEHSQETPKRKFLLLFLLVERGLLAFLTRRRKAAEERTLEFNPVPRKWEEGERALQKAMTNFGGCLWYVHFRLRQKRGARQ